MKTLRYILAAAAFCAFANSAVQADSIYKKQVRSMFADRKAVGVGDIVTVLITETTVASQQADTNLNRDVKASATGGSKGPFNLLSLIPRASLGGSASHKGTGSTSRSSNLVSQITCRVTEVTQNGLLVIKGDHWLRVNADNQVIRLTGTIRPDDIQTDNTIASSFIADGKIDVVGKGPIDQHTRPGLLMRVFQFLF